MTNYYKVLQVAPEAEPDVIDAAYRRLARKWHPDANPDPAAADRIRELNEAYEVLSDPARRRAYDARRLVSSVGLGSQTVPVWLVPVGLGFVALVLIARLGRVGLLLVAALGAWYAWARLARR